MKIINQQLTNSYHRNQKINHIKQDHFQHLLIEKLQLVLLPHVQSFFLISVCLLIQPVYLNQEEQRNKKYLNKAKFPTAKWNAISNPVIKALFSVIQVLEKVNN